jgi:hypothetical protein
VDWLRVLCSPARSLLYPHSLHDLSASSLRDLPLIFCLPEVLFCLPLAARRLAMVVCARHSLLQN